MKKLIALLVVLMMLGTVAASLADTVIVAFFPEYPPFEFVNGEAYEGYDVDLIKAVAEKAELEIEFCAMDFDAIIAAVQSNINTIGVSGISITEDRKLSVDFSEGYINAGLVVVVRKSSGFAATDDLKGKIIGEPLGTTANLLAEDITGHDNVVEYKSFLSAIMDLRDSKIDAVIIDKPVGMAILASLGDDSLEIVDMGLPTDWYGIEVNKENPELLVKINSALKELEAEGFYEELAHKYFSDSEDAAE